VELSLNMDVSQICGVNTPAKFMVPPLNGRRMNFMNFDVMRARRVATLALKGLPIYMYGSSKHRRGITIWRVLPPKTA
jgi:hypothetical protein